MRAILDLRVGVDDLIVDGDVVLTQLHYAVLIKGNGPGGARIDPECHGYTALMIAVMLPKVDGKITDVLINHGTNFGEKHGRYNDPPLEYVEPHR